MRPAIFRLSAAALSLAGLFPLGAVHAQSIVPPPVAPPSVVSSAAAGAVPAPAAGHASKAVAATKPTATAAPSVAAPALPAPPRTALAKPVPIPVDGGSHLEAFAGLATTPVSDSQLNRFVFPEPIEGVYFPEGAPLPTCPDNAAESDLCHPVFLNGRRVMLLQLRAGARGPVQMLVHLHSGKFLTLNLNPAPGPGAVVRADGATDGASDSRLADGQAAHSGEQSAGGAASEQYVDLLSHFARGDIPSAFEPEVPGQAVRFEYFDVIPMAVWGDGDRLRVHLFKVRALGDKPVKVNAALFKTKTIKAVALDRDTITYKNPALLYAVEVLPEDNQ